MRKEHKYTTKEEEKKNPTREKPQGEHRRTIKLENK